MSIPLPSPVLHPGAFPMGVYLKQEKPLLIKGLLKLMIGVLNMHHCNTPGNLSPNSDAVSKALAS